MAITPDEIRAWILNRIDTSVEPNWADQNDVSSLRGIQTKYDHQLQELKALYKNKVPRIVQRYEDSLTDVARYIKNFDIPKAELRDELEGVKSKVIRLADKWLAVKREIEGREKGYFICTPVGTVYYIDLNTGNDTNDGLGTGTAWLTIEKYTTTTVRSAGDIAYVRANTSEIPVGIIVFDENGTIAARISIIGCDSVVNDPWGDASDIDPVIDFNSNAYYLQPSSDNYWHLENIEVKNASAYNVLSANAYSWYCKDVVIKDSGNRGLNLGNGSWVFEGGEIKDNTSFGILNGSGGRLWLKSTILDGGAGGQAVGLQNDGGYVEITDSTIGVTNAHSANDITCHVGGQVYMRNVNLGTGGLEIASGGMIFSEDDEQVKGSQIANLEPGKITKDTGVVRIGGADSSAKIEPNSGCDIYNPLTMNWDSIIHFPFKIWCAASATTITVYIRSFGTWGTYPTATELYLEASYLSHATLATRTTVVSNDVLSDGTTWVAFDCAFTPAQAGWVYLNVYLKKYEASKGCYVDIKPVVS